MVYSHCFSTWKSSRNIYFSPVMVREFEVTGSVVNDCCSWLSLNQKTVVPLESDVQIPGFSNKQHLLKNLDFKIVVFMVLMFI